MESKHDRSEAGAMKRLILFLHLLLLFALPACASVTLVPSSLSFGNVNVGAGSTLSFSVTIAGFGPYSITSFSNTDTAEFTSTLANVGLSVGANNFSVTLSPTSAGAKSDTFAIFIFNGADSSTTEYDLAVSGTGLAGVYVAQTAGTFSGGSHCNGQTAVTVATFNASTPSPGTLIYLCGTITGAAGATGINFPNFVSGTLANPIIVRADTGFDLTAPYWANAINMYGSSYVTLDGVGVGTIENTQNGTGLTYEQTSTGINVNSSSGVTGVVIKNWTIKNIQTHTSDSDATRPGTDGIHINSGCISCSITRNSITDVDEGIVYSGGSISTPDTGTSFTWNTLSRINWGFDIGNGYSTAALFAFNDVSCVIGAACNWCTNGSNACGSAYHHNGFFLESAVGVHTNMTFNANYVHDVNPSSGYIGPCGGCMYVNLILVNNVGFTTAGQQGGTNGDFGVLDGILANNTVIGPGATSTVSSSGVGGTGNGSTSFTAKNNIVQAMGLGETNGGSFGTFVSDYNNFYNLYGNCCFGGIMDKIGTFYATVAAWTAASPGAAWDAHSTIGNPNLAGSAPFVITSTAAGGAYQTGTNLTSLGIAALDIGAPQTFGVTGNCGTGCLPRPATGPWDMGSYPFSGGAPTPTVPTSILPLTLANGQAGTSYPSAQLSVSGGVPPYSFMGTALPAGLLLSSAGMLNGTPTIASGSSPKVQVTDANGASLTKIYSLTINAAPVPPLPASYKCGTWYIISIDVKGNATNGPQTFSCVKQ